jgi:hypothetical protein
LSHGNAPPNPDSNDDEDNNKDDKEDEDEDEGDVMMTFNEVARCSQGDSYSAERAGTAAADQPVTTPPTNRTPISLLAVATTAINDTINNAINERMRSTSRDESIVATIVPFDKGPESNRGGRTMSEVAIPEGRRRAQCKRCIATGGGGLAIGTAGRQRLRQCRYLVVCLKIVRNPGSHESVYAGNNYLILGLHTNA